MKRAQVDFDSLLRYWLFRLTTGSALISYCLTFAGSAPTRMVQPNVNKFIRARTVGQAYALAVRQAAMRICHAQGSVRVAER